MDKITLALMHFTFVLGLGYYFMTAMQWYSYRLERILLHFHRYDWHVYFLIIPLIGYYLLHGIYLNGFILVYIIALLGWVRKIDRKLVFTSRVKRFMLFLILAIFFQDILCFTWTNCSKFGVVIPLILAQLISMVYEKILFEGFKKTAHQKLMQRPTLKVIAITASYGKTSIKNFLAQILSSTLRVYHAPRSVNTLGGIMKDINESLPEQCDVYIVEAGARLRGDIDQITHFVNPHIAVVGSIGEQHIEYFKTLENIRNTKMEIIHSSRLEKAFVHESAMIHPTDKIVSFGSEITHIEASLDGLAFDMCIEGQKVHFTCNLLGAFNTINIAAAIHVAYELGFSLKSIQHSVTKLYSIEHRLQKIEAGGKFIIDDSFNGNLEGMLSSYDLVNTYQGRKVIVTPGIVESTEAANRVLGEKIDAIFDLVILTGKTNIKVLDDTIQHAKKIILIDKIKLQETLAQHTKAGDMILFSNDAPNFI